MNDELKRIWIEAVVTYLKVICTHFPEETEGIHEVLSQYSRCPARDSKWEPPARMNVRCVTGQVVYAEHTSGEGQRSNHY